MIIHKFDELKNPLYKFWNDNGYRNTSFRSQINVVCNEKKRITEFTVPIQDMLLHAIRNYSNLEVILSFHSLKENAMNYYQEYLSKDYLLWGFKRMNFKTDDEDVKSEMIHKLLYQLLFERNKSKKYIREHYSWNENSMEDKNIFVYFLCKKNLNIDYWSDSSNRIFSPQSKEERDIATTIVFNDESWNMIKLQNFDFFTISDMNESKEKFSVFRNWLIRNIPMDKQSSFMLYSSVIFYILGHRNMNDIDLYIHSFKDHHETKDEIETENEDSTVQQTKEINIMEEIVKETLTFPFMDYSMKNTEKWPKYWDTWLDEWAKLCGARYFEEILCNANYHFYFLGVKIISLDCDIKRRIYRNRPRAIADLISLRKRYGLSISIPRIPSETFEYMDVSDKSSEEIAVLLKEGGKYNHPSKEIISTKKIDESNFLRTVQWALKERYRMTFTIDEILHELNMNSSRRKETSELKMEKLIIDDNSKTFEIKKELEVSLKSVPNSVSNSAPNSVSNSAPNSVLNSIPKRIKKAMIQKNPLISLNPNVKEDSNNSNTKKIRIKKKT